MTLRKAANYLTSKIGRFLAKTSEWREETLVIKVQQIWDRLSCWLNKKIPCSLVSPVPMQWNGRCLSFKILVHCSRQWWAAGAADRAYRTRRSKHCSSCSHLLRSLLVPKPAPVSPSCLGHLGQHCLDHCTTGSSCFSCLPPATQPQRSHPTAADFPSAQAQSIHLEQPPSSSCLAPVIHILSTFLLSIGNFKPRMELTYLKFGQVQFF